MTILRHRNGETSAVSPSKTAPIASSAKFRTNKSSNRTHNRSYLPIVLFTFGSLLVIYLFVASSFVVTDNNNNNNNNNNNHNHNDGQLLRTSKTAWGRKNGGGDKIIGKGGGKEEGRQSSLYTKKHIPVPLSELIPHLQSTKERYRSIDDSYSGDRTHNHNPVKSQGKIFKAYDRKNKIQLEKKRDKAGKVVYTPITSVNREDLTDMLGLSQKEIKTLSNITHEEAIKGRERLVDILNEAGIVDVDPIAILKLPKWSSVTKLYGDKPVILGLERCEEFRTTFPLDDASIGTAGLFNTGTNPFAMYISENCKLPNNKHDKAGGTRWQVPWGKHMLAERRWTNTAGHDFKVNKTNVMPVVLVRDPYTWMQSMCKHPYEARWQHKYSQLCPNLAHDELLSDGRPDMVSVHLKYKPPAEFKSLAHFWGEYYKQYLEADYPRLIVRFEDIQFHAKELIETVCQCAGAVPRNDDAVFRFVVDSAKWGAAHKSETNMISAMIKYGSDKNRFTGMTESDFLVAREVFTPEIMELFGYEMPPPTP